MAALVVPCPKCATRLSAPESAVGKQIRCPRCGGLATVPDLLPAQEVEVVEAKVVVPPQQRVSPPPVLPKKPIAVVDPTEDRSDRESLPPEDGGTKPRKKKRPRRDEDDDYEHDYRPRRRPRRKSGGGGLVAGLVIGLMLVLAAGGFAVYFFAGKGKSGLFAKRAPVPAGWEQYTYPQDGFKVYLPKGATYTSVPADGLRPGAGRGGRLGPRGFDWDDDLPPLDRVAVVKTNDWTAPVQIELVVVRFRDPLPSSVRNRMRRGFDDAKIGDVGFHKTTWLGHDAVEQTHPTGVMRVVSTDRHFVIAMINGTNGARATPEEEAGFFDNLEITN